MIVICGPFAVKIDHAGFVFEVVGRVDEFTGSLGSVNGSAPSKAGKYGFGIADFELPRSLDVEQLDYSVVDYHCVAL